MIRTNWSVGLPLLGLASLLGGCGAAADRIEPGVEQGVNAGEQKTLRDAAHSDRELPNDLLASREQAERLERDFGGVDALVDFFRNNPESVVREALANYTIGYEVHTQAITDCNQYFPAADRSVWHNFNGEFYYIDGSGRPNKAYTFLPPIAAEARSTTCQTSVGQWGDAENPSNDYDGGHLIGSQLGGYGRRANLVPQDANFNRGNWAVLENKMATCAGLPNGPFRYYITVGYPNGSALIPSTFSMQLTNQSTGSGVTLSFSNTDGGGSNGPSEKTRGVTFLTNNGCN